MNQKRKPARKPARSTSTTVCIPRHGETDLQFDGVLLGEASSDDGQRPSWIEMRAYRTSGGNIVLAIRKHTRRDGSTRADAKVYQTIEDMTDAEQWSQVFKDLMASCGHPLVERVD